MNNMKKLIKIINPDDVVIADNCIKINGYKNLNDVRSACFYTFGCSKISNKNTVLVIDGNYLTNCLTVLTEAWFQKTNLVIIALYDSVYDVNVHYLDRCVVYNKLLLENDIEKYSDELVENINKIGPKVINIVCENKICEKNIDYTMILNCIKNVKDFDIFLYNSCDNNINDNVNIHNIESKYKYGIISKYLAYSFSNNNKNSLLICSDGCFKLDLNILNNQNVNKNFKIIVLGNIENEKEWIIANQIKYYYSDVLKEEKIIIDFLNYNGPSILSLNVEVK